MNTVVQFDYLELYFRTMDSNIHDALWFRTMDSNIHDTLWFRTMDSNFYAEMCFRTIVFLAALCCKAQP